jgi:hypothetical protein
MIRSVRPESCPVCGSRVFVDDLHCLHCGAELVFSLGGGGFVADAIPCWWRESRRCNWDAAGSAGACLACIRIDASSDALQQTELSAIYCAAIRRTLRRLQEAYGVDPAAVQPQLRFRLEVSTGGHDVTIGHDDGLVTLDVAEADAVHLAAQRQALGEPYRTPLGHVRHETGHWLWAVGVAPDVDRLSRFRQLFGDERDDYQAALARHYDGPDDGSWQAEWISHYAASHPWEDFAESTAHVFHIDDVTNAASVARLVGLDGWTFADRYRAWTSLVVELNEISRAMGEADLYPFAPPSPAIDKMHFVDEVLRAIGPG